LYCREFLEYQLRKDFTSKYGQPLAHVTSDAVRVFHVAFGMQKDSIFREKFSQLIGHLGEAGLVDMWRMRELDKVIAKCQLTF
jgi:hypothetical protein